MVGCDQNNLFFFAKQIVSASRMRVQLLFLVAFALLVVTMAQQDNGKRRRIKKKIVKNRVVPERRVLRVEEEEGGVDGVLEQQLKEKAEVEEQDEVKALRMEVQSMRNFLRRHMKRVDEAELTKSKREEDQRRDLAEEMLRKAEEEQAAGELESLSKPSNVSAAASSLTYSLAMPAKMSWKISSNS